jgi:hypothetical protein
MVTAPDTAPTSMPPEGQARALLRGHPGDGLETWLAEQRWRAALDGSWTVEPARDGRTYRVEGVPGRRSVRVIERASVAGAVTSWLIV